VLVQKQCNIKFNFDNSILSQVLRLQPVKCLKQPTIIKNFDFAVNNFLMKLLQTVNTDITKYRQVQFGFKLPSELIPNCTVKFIAKLQLQNL